MDHLRSATEMLAPPGSNEFVENMPARMGRGIFREMISSLHFNRQCPAICPRASDDIRYQCPDRAGRKR